MSWLIIAFVNSCFVYSYQYISYNLKSPHFTQKLLNKTLKLLQNWSCINVASSHTTYRMPTAVNSYLITGITRHITLAGNNSIFAIHT
jgi:hypothetical protein